MDNVVNIKTLLFKCVFRNEFNKDRDEQNIVVVDQNIIVSEDENSQTMIVTKENFIIGLQKAGIQFNFIKGFQLQGKIYQIEFKIQQVKGVMLDVHNILVLEQEQPLGNQNYYDMEKLLYELSKKCQNQETFLNSIEQRYIQIEKKLQMTQLHNNQSLSRQDSIGMKATYSESDITKSSNKINQSQTQSENRVQKIDNFFDQNYMSNLNQQVTYSLNRQQNEQSLTMIIHPEKLDLIYLYSQPLLYKKNNIIYQYDNSLDYDDEISSLEFFLKISSKQFQMRMDAANFEILQSSIVKAPKILHISCHGSYIYNENQYCLQFEKPRSGKLDQLTEKRLLSLLKDKVIEGVQLVFISACHSELIGKIFYDQNVPVVVAVNSDSMILDEVCNLFSRNFYSYLLLGSTVLQAFKDAQGTITQMSNPSSKFSCCCAHLHDPQCRWLKYYDKYGSEAAHELHSSKNCIHCDKNSLYHKKNCQNYLNFKRELEKIDSDSNNAFLDVPLSSQDPIICCCKHKVEYHDEKLKFILYGEEKAKEMKIFTNIAKGKVQIEDNLNLVTNLHQNIEYIQILGRKDQVLQIIKDLFSITQSKRLIHIYGEKALGKTDIVQFSSKYVLMRRKFDSGAYYIDLNECNQIEEVIAEINKELNNNFQDNQRVLLEYLKGLDMLLIFDNCDHIFNSEHKDKFVQFIEKIVDNTYQIKLILITTKGETLKRAKKQQITGLNDYYKAKLLIEILKNSYKIEFEKLNFNMLKQHPAFVKLSNIPYKVKLIADSLYLVIDNKQTITQQELINKIQQIYKNNQDQREKEQFSINQFFQNMNQLLNINQINLLSLLSQFKDGLLFSDLFAIIKQNQEKYSGVIIFLENIKNKKYVQLNEQQVKTYLKVDKILCDQDPILIEDNLHFSATYYTKETLNKFLSESQKLEYYIEILTYYTKLSILIFQKTKEYNFRHLFKLSANYEKENQFWNDQNLLAQVQQNIQDMPELIKAEDRFKFYQETFRILIKKFHEYVQQQVDMRNQLEYISEILINTIFMHYFNDQYQQCMLLIECGINICNFYEQMKLTKARILLLKAMVQLKIGNNGGNVQNFIIDAYSILKQFSGLKIAQIGIAECFYYSLVFLIANLKNNTTIQVDQRLLQLQPDGAKKISSHQYNLSEIKDNQYKYTQKNGYSTFNDVEIQFNKAATQLNFIQNLEFQYKFILLEGEFFLDYFNNEDLLIQDKEIILSKLEKKTKFLIKNFQSQDNKLQDYYKVFYLKSIIQLSNINLYQNIISSATQKIQEAFLMIEKYEFQCQKQECNEVNSKITNYIRSQTNLDFVFWYANPLISDNITTSFQEFGENVKNIIYPLKNVYCPIHDTLKERFEKSNKKINYKFDILNETVLKQLPSLHCKVLQISSKIIERNSNSLYIEKDTTGEFLKINMKDLEDTLSFEGKLNIDVIILESPQGLEFAKLFFNYGVKYIITFNFDQKIIDSIFDNYSNYKMGYIVAEFMEEFQFKFIKKILQKQDIYQAFKNTKYDIDKSLISKLPLFPPELLKQSTEIICQQTMNAQKQRKQKLTTSSFKFDFEIGKSTDYSNIKGVFESEIINKHGIISIGRYNEFYKIITAILQTNPNQNKRINKIIMIYSQRHGGKSKFINDLSIYLRDRTHPQDEVYVLDYLNYSDLKRFDSLIKDANISKLGNGGAYQQVGFHQLKKTILFIDNIDYYQNANELQKWISYIFHKYPTTQLIFTTTKRFIVNNNQPFQIPIYYQKIQHLDQFEEKCLNDIKRDREQKHQNKIKNMQQEINISNVKINQALISLNRSSSEIVDEESILKIQNQNPENNNQLLQKSMSTQVNEMFNKKMKKKGLAVVEEFPRQRLESFQTDMNNSQTATNKDEESKSNRLNLSLRKRLSNQEILRGQESEDSIEKLDPDQKQIKQWKHYYNYEIDKSNFAQNFWEKQALKQNYRNRKKIIDQKRNQSQQYKRQQSDLFYFD